MKIFDFLIYCNLKAILKYFKTENLETAYINSAIAQASFLVMIWTLLIFMIIEFIFVNNHFLFIIPLFIIFGARFLINYLKDIYITNGRLNMILDTNGPFNNVSGNTVSFVTYALFIAPLIIMIGGIALFFL